MQPLKARVEDGRVIVEEKAELPNGEIYLLPVSAEELRDAELDRELLLSLKDEEEGQFVPFRDVISSLGS